MKSQQAHIYNSRLFTFIILLLCSFYSGYSQTTVQYTVSGTWTCPAGVTTATVEVWGGGGGGGGSINTNSNAGGGGGGGAYVKKTITVAAGNYTFTIGAAGIGGGVGANGTAGDNSIFGSNLVIANGGGFGSFGSSGARGTGGIASGGDLNYNGGNGAAGVNVTGSGGGGGGAGTTGAGGNATGITAGLGTTLYGGDGGAGVTVSANGLPGATYSGGGSGGYGKGKPGGNGASGYMRITYTVVSNNCPTSTSITPTAAQNLCQGTAAGLVTATITTSGGSGTPTLLYQWYYNITSSNTVTGATKIAGATSQTYRPLSTASEVGTRYYFCVGYATNNSCAQTDATQSLASGAVQVTVSAPPTTANAGSTQNITVSTATLNGNTPTVGTGTWTKISGSGTITAPSSRGTTVTGLTNGSSVFRWTISNGACIASWSEVTINVTLPVCSLTASGLANKICNNNGTPSNPGDDTFSFTLNPTGTLLGATYNVSGSITRSGVSYGSATTFSGNLISAGNLTITITDVSTNCSFGPFTITPPATCSSACNITSSGLNSIICNNIATLTNATDDTFSFKLKPTGTSLGATYNVSGSITRTGISYGTETTFTGYLISAGNLSITITDVSTNCSFGPFTVTAPAPCSLNHGPSNCTSCHITHSAPGSSLSNVAGNALLCQSCHTSTGAASAKPLVNANKANPLTNTGNSHSWDVLAINSTYQTTTPTNAEMANRLPLGRIICSTCHNQHNNGSAGSPYLRVSNIGDAMCKDCHSVRNVLRFQDGVTNKGSHPVGIVYNTALSKLEAVPKDPALKTPGGKVECSSCHALHDVSGALALTNDGNLLRVTNDINLCRDCHTYTGHRGFDCRECHEVHNTVDGTIGNNIYMIRDIIQGKTVRFYAETGLNSFVDSNTTYDGVCEVCHTSTTHHRSNGSLTTHNDGSDKRGQSCVGCHFHNVGFATPSGPLTCIGCHSTTQPGGRGGSVQIVGAGGEMGNSLPSRHTASGVGTDPVNSECEACHFDNGTTHPTSVMMLRNPDAAAVYSGDVDVYCIRCHDGNAPTTPANFSYINTAIYNKASYIGTPHDNSANSCLGCHKTHGSQNPALTNFATNYEACFDCHDGTGASTTISAATIATPGVSGTGHAFNVSASSALYQSNAPSDPKMSSRLASGNIVCSTCHDPHANTNGKLLVSPNNTDQMCKNCHVARNLGRYKDNITTNKGSHPVGLTYVAGGNYVTPAPTLSKTNVGLLSGKIECSSCHSTHNNTTNDGNLLREAITNAACKECHNYKPHKGFDCLDCHQTHNGTNIMLIKSIVNGRSVVFNSQGTTATPVQLANKSFADGDAIYDGICEVCHTTTAYHKNTNDNANHHDGKSCVSCHSHNALPPPAFPQVLTSFPNGSCHSCHESTGPSDPNVYPMTGAHDKHSGALYGYKCSECHFGRGTSEPTHPSSTADVIFNPTGLASRGGLDIPLWGTPTWNSVTKTCSNIYCHSNGRSAVRGTDGVLPWSPTRTSQQPFYGGSTTTTQIPTARWDTGKITTCTPCHRGKGNMTSPYTITTSPLSPSAHLILSYATDAPTSGLHTHTAMFNDSADITGPTGAGATQCYLCHNTNGAANNGTNYQGTYGSPLKKHVDGQTYFKHALFANGGTWSPWNGPNGYMDHCISKDASW